MLAPMTTPRQSQIESLSDKEYRDIYVSEAISSGIAFQIREMRKQRAWNQAELGQKAEMAQESISKLENPDYGKFTLSTLKRLASAFDVALIVRFAPFSQLVDWATDLGPEDLAVPAFENDQGLPRLPALV